MNQIMDTKVYGDGHTRCRFTDLPIEVGSGALSVDEQAIANLGKLEFNLAELKQRRKDHADKEWSEIARGHTMLADHSNIAADNIAARQSSVYSMARQDHLVQNLKRQGAALAAEQEALAEQIAVVRVKLREEGILQRYGESAASSFRGQIRDRGFAA